MMYWSTVGNQASIEKASMDGTNREILHNTTLSFEVYALTLDIPTQTLYWVDSAFGRLESSAVDGSNRRLIIQDDNIILSFGIVAYNNGLYFSDFIQNTINYVGNANESNVTVVNPHCGLASVLGIQVVDQFRQPQGRVLYTNLHRRPSFFIHTQALILVSLVMESAVTCAC